MAAGQTTNQSDYFKPKDFAASGWIFGLEDGRVAIGWGQLQWSDRAKSDRVCIYAPDFYLKSKMPWLSTASWSLITREELSESLSYEKGVEVTWSEPPKAAFAETFSFLQDAFCSGLAKKSVPVVFAVGTSPKTEISKLLKAALSAPKNLRLYGFWNESGGMLGLTPELLFRFQGNKIESMALAGTRRGQLTPEEKNSFLSDPKERHEHQLVVDDLKQCFKNWGEPEVGVTEVVQLPTLAHIYTPVSVAPLQAKDFESVARALHPTPALGVSPRKLGLEWMATWDDPELRERYGAPFGLRAGHEIQECLVAIRNVQWHDNGARKWKLGSGCGVVRQSELENEWRELAAKRESVRKLLGL